MKPFQPLFRNPHLQTIAGHYWKRPAPRAFPVERRLFETEPGVRVLVESQRPDGVAAGEVVLVHGLEGSGAAGYMQSLSAVALEAGFAAHRFNMRTCGGTELLSPTLYHAGLTSDLLWVLREFLREGRSPVFLVGFSLGGNVVLKLAGEAGDDALAWISGVCAVSTPLDLSACSHRIAQPDNRLYERRFVIRMRDRLCATGRYTKGDFAGLETVIGIDQRITAPSFGFGDAENYYRTQSAIRFLGGLKVPALLIQAKDDTFVPFEIYQSEAVRSNPRIELWATEHGGHLGFLGRRPHRFWADHAVMSWIREQGAKAAGDLSSLARTDTTVDRYHPFSS
ncbi:MAG TPA: alpha/beta fold hydrolase [Bryobacteraceae bacterium]|nr:alpha/beta fold hydrolase [Bryobacteraceae bacterium]